MVPLSKSFDFNLKKGSSKKFRMKYFSLPTIYESLDERSLSYAMSRKTMKKRIQDKALKKMKIYKFV